MTFQYAPGTLLFHGGAPGLAPGDIIEPGHDRFVAGCPTCEARRAGAPTIDPPTKHADRVYVTSDREYARFYASMFPSGDLYTVDPIGEVLPSDEDQFPTWHIPAARVRGVYDRYVQLKPAQRRRLLVRWANADLARAAAEQGSRAVQ